MSTVFLALTVLALAAAAALGGLTWHLLRQEKRRSEARIAALASALDAMSGSPSREGRAVTAPVSDLFARPTSAASTGSHLIKAAAGLTMAVVVIVAAAAGRGGEGEARTGSAARSATAPLELMTMRHARKGDTLTVSGLVRNPRGGEEVRRVTAVVVAYDRTGAFVASGRAPLDFTLLEPGGESPFVVTIPGIDEVGRYRVSFQTDRGGLRHVDRRGEQGTTAAAHRP
jgi:hypothetical protein